MIEPAISGGGKDLGCGRWEQTLWEAAERSGFEIVKSTATSGAKEGENGTGFWRFSSGLWRPSSCALAK
jgi:hypothetical protein